MTERATNAAPEFSRIMAVRQAEGREIEISASPAERAALSERFGLVRIESLGAVLQLSRKDEEVSATGRLKAQIVQSCAVSGEDLPVAVDEPLSFLFVPARPDVDEEVELEESDCDEIAYEGDRFDLGEAVAQSLALAIDPFAVGPQADAVRKKVGLDEPERENPFAALKGLGSPG